MHSPVVVCCALLIVFYGALSFNVSRVRRRRRSDATIPEAALTKAIRAHGNAAEYVPLFVAGLLYLQSAAPSPFVSVLAVAALACRLAHAAGMLLPPTVDDRHLLKFIGALGTYGCLFALGGALFLQGLPGGA